MAEDNKYDRPTSDKSFWDDPVVFCQGLYDKYDEYNKTVRDRVIENREFYEGFDQQLEDRKNNARTVRSSAFVHELRPAIETANSVILDAAMQQENPMKMTRTRDSEDTPDHITRMEEKLNEIMRETGVLNVKFQEVLNGGALMPIVAAKVGWETREGWVYRKAKPTEMLGQMVQYFATMGQSRPPEKIKKEWGTVYSGPYCEILDSDEFLYDDEADSLDSCEAVVHRRWMSWNEFVNYLIDNNFDDSRLDKIREELKLAAGDTENDPITDEIKADIEGRSKYYQGGKVLVCEFWVPVFDKDGRQQMRVFVMAANKYRLSRGRFGSLSPWDKIRYPFVTLAFNKQFNRMEGTPLVELGKWLQRVYNDNINAYIDYLSYNVFPIIKRAPGTRIQGKPKFGPGQVWDVTNPDGLEVVHIPSGDVGQVIPFAALMAGKIRQLINAPDTSEGIEGQPSESKVKTRARLQGTTTRSRVPAKVAGDFLIGVAKKFIYMYQMMGDPDWMINVKLDVPSLTGAKTPEEEREEAVFLLDASYNNPIYQNTPTGLSKIRELTANVYRKFRMRDIDKVLPSETELDLINPIGKAVDDVVEADNQEKNQPSSPEPEGKIVPLGGETEEKADAI